MTLQLELQQLEHWELYTVMSMPDNLKISFNHLLTVEVVTALCGLQKGTNSLVLLTSNAFVLSMYSLKQATTNKLSSAYATNSITPKWLLDRIVFRSSLISNMHLFSLEHVTDTLCINFLTSLTRCKCHEHGSFQSKIVQIQLFQWMPLHFTCKGRRDIPNFFVSW